MSNFSVVKDISGLTVEQLGKEFVANVGIGVEAFKRAGDIIVEIERRDPQELLKLQKRHGIPEGVLKLFLKIGRGVLLPQLLSAPSFIRKLPVGDQRVLVEGSVEALVMKANGEVDTIRVDVLSSDPKILKQVCGPDGIRSAAQQRQWLIAEANRERAKNEVGQNMPEAAPWHAVGKKIVVTAGVTLTAKDLSTMLAAIS